MAKIKSKKTATKLKSKQVKSPSSKGVKTSAKKKTVRTKSAVKPLKQKKTLAVITKTTKTKIKTKENPKTDKKKINPLRENKIQEIRASLLKQRSSLLNEAEVALNELPGQTVFPDLGDQASAETDRNFMLRLRGREQRLLKKIDEALDRIENDIFGICEDCGEEIDIKRLEARPVTTMCIDCKTVQEEEEKLRES